MVQGVRSCSGQTVGRQRCIYTAALSHCCYDYDAIASSRQTALTHAAAGCHPLSQPCTQQLDSPCRHLPRSQAASAAAAAASASCAAGLSKWLRLVWHLARTRGTLTAGAASCASFDAAALSSCRGWRLYRTQAASVAASGAASCAAGPGGTMAAAGSSTASRS